VGQIVRFDSVQFRSSVFLLTSGILLCSVSLFVSVHPRNGVASFDLSEFLFMVAGFAFSNSKI
jgi:hypothetical protein